MKMALAPDESGILGGQKWHLHTEKRHFCGFQGEQRGRKGGIYRGFSLQNGCSGRGCLNNICIASYGVGAKFFTTNLMSVDLPQNTPKTRKPIAERTSHGWHGYTTRGCSSLCCTKQLLLLPRNARNAQNLLLICPPTDFTDLHRCLWCAVLQQNTEYRIGQRGYAAGMPYPPNL